MIIQENIGNVIIKVGSISKNHVEFINGSEVVPNKSVLIHINQWNEMKIKIDKMFKIVQES